MKMVSMGTKKKAYKSIKMAAAAAGVPYMTYYMRLRMGMTAKQAATKPVRQYTKRSSIVDNNDNAFMVRQ